jgi:ferredoxin--NADP+ reductase
MTFVILQQCCNDASCVSVCPVDCIRPRPGDAEFMSAEMLHIDPSTCIDCGACVDECPVDAIKADEHLSPFEIPYLKLNSTYFDDNPIDPDDFVDTYRSAAPSDLSGLRVAIVGSGPAAFYAAMELEGMNGPHVEMFERLYTPFGLVRFGVAPDHQSTKAVTDVFRTLERRPAFKLNLGVEVGVHVTHQELLDRHHAVIYAVGGSADRRLGIAGEDMSGSHAATEFVAWYNGHPDYADKTFDLSTERVVIIGNGNVALDVARILLSDPEALALTDIADHALEALRASKVREVVVVGRRDVAQASFTNPEMIALCRLPGVDVVIEGTDLSVWASSAPEDSAVRFKVDFAREVAAREPTGAAKRLVLRYLTSPIRLEGEGRVESVYLVRNELAFDDDGSVRAVQTGDEDILTAGLVLRSVGYRGTGVPGVPFDAAGGVIPNKEGRVQDAHTGDVATGVYVSGWIKRGASGVIGTNKQCASDTVTHLVKDYLDGRLTDPVKDASSINELLRASQPAKLDFEGWARLDRAERAAGTAQGRPRIKFVDPLLMLEAARADG